ncbi:MAG TPA: hypothetical protein VIQ03_01580 [Gammaproteobacteria bacterium]
MNKVKPLIIYMFGLIGFLLVSITTVSADENPFSEKDNTPSSSENNRSFMQGMCGMGRCGRCGSCGGGMMWRGDGKPKIGDITELPEPQSQGAKLLNRYCTQCHALPNPKLHSAEGWNPTVERMRARMQWMSQNDSGIAVPVENEFETLMIYLRKHAK